MAIRAEAVEILVRKSRFEPEAALGVAEAIEVSMSLAQLVTVPVLDSRLQELRHEFKADVQMLKGEIQTVRADFKAELATDLGKMQVLLANELGKIHIEMQKVHTELQKFHTELQKVRADLVRWVFLTMLGSVALSMGGSTALKMLTN